MNAAPKDMMSGAPADPFEAAAYWHELLDEGPVDAEEQAAFERWLAADPAHRDAYARVVAMWRGAGEAASDPVVLELRKAAKAPEISRPAWSRRATFGAAAALVLAVVAAAFLVRPPASNHVFETAVGERSTITLADGSRVTLNTASRLETAFTPRERAVRLVAGQALFEVAKNPDRPFVVTAGGQRVTAIGTAFDVRVDDRGAAVQVTLIEGVVLVEATAAGNEAASEGVEPPAPTRLAPGEQIVTAAAAPAVVRRADVERVTSWREGRLIFEAERLGDAVAEVNRYSRTKIVLADPELASLSVSGVFDAGRSDSFVEALSTFYGLEAREVGSGRIMLAQGD